MPIKSNYPTDTQISNYQNQVGEINQTQQIAYNQDNYLFSSGMLDKDMFKVMLYKYKNPFTSKYHLHTLMQWFGHYSSTATATQEVEWRELGKTRLPISVTATTATGSATITVDDNVAEQRHQVNDVFHSSRTGGYLVYVTAVGVGAGAGGVTQYTLAKVDGTVFGATDIAANDILGNSHNIWAEGSGQPTGKRWSPEVHKNKLTRTKASYGYTGDAISEFIEFETPGAFSNLWCDFEASLTFNEFLTSRENVLFAGERSVDGAALMGGQGILKYVMDDGIAGQGFTGTVAETDIQAVLTNFNQFNANLEYLCLGGQEIRTSISNVLSTFVKDGGVFYGNFSAAEGIALGLNVTQYSFNGYILDIAPFLHFDNEDELGSIPGAYVTGSRRYTNTALVLNGGMAPMTKSFATDANGRTNPIPYVSYVYKSTGETNRSFVCGYRKGMTGRNHPAMLTDPMSKASFDKGFIGMNNVQSDIDQDDVYFLSQIGLRMPLASVSHSSLFQNG